MKLFESGYIEKLKDFIKTKQLFYYKKNGENDLSSFAIKLRKSEEYKRLADPQTKTL